MTKLNIWSGPLFYKLIMNDLEMAIFAGLQQLFEVIQNGIVCKKSISQLEDIPDKLFMVANSGLSNDMKQ